MYLPFYVDVSNPTQFPDDLWLQIFKDGKLQKLYLGELLCLRTVCKSWNRLICQFPKIKTTKGTDPFFSQGIQDPSRLPTVFSCLRSLNLEFGANTISDPKLSLLTGIQSLKFDTTHWTELTFPWSADMSEFSCLTNLTKLTLASDYITSLGTLTHLTCLRLHDPVGIPSTELNRLPNLKSFGSYKTHYQSLWKYTGYGVSKESGSVLRGQFVDGSNEGPLTFDPDDGSIFEGRVTKGRMCGRVSLKPGSSTEYFGYVGEIKDHMKHGPGVVYSPNSRTEATWVEDKKQGQGIEYTIDGTTEKIRYKGMFVDDQMEGQGIFYFSNGAMYEGEFLGGLSHGRGTYYFEDGVRYEGTIEAGERHGFGTLYYPVTGVKTESTYTRNKKNGNGILYFPDGDRWEGTFQDHVAQGNGILFCVDGNQQEISFDNVSIMKRWDQNGT